MPAYLVVHAERRGDDTVIEDPHLTVEFVNGWVLFKDRDLIKPTASFSPSPPCKSPASNG
ncbi:hypothetical protein [Streptomyces sp.]|uniref:hypothetical protein n=1 Tax=Streptomyces sp. TaxID=1931 RepID=UPI0028115547|nr:hypothetical protein [Streptomyces sp.]